jgi:glyoxylase-like metal-dependent hydrolase (beta-lactamase superfamily II)
MFRIGDVSIRRIEESLGHGFAPEMLFPDADPALFRQQGPATAANFYDAAADRLMSSIHTWLVRTPRHVILIDTCAGNHKHRPMMARFHGLETPFLERLKAEGVTPAQVDLVICTHLHVDHVGWNTRLQEGRWVPTFPNARYVISRREVEFWSAQARAAQSDADLTALIHFDSVQPILDSGQTELIEDGFALEDNFLLRHAPGHTPGQMIARLDRHGERAIFSGDVMHHPIQIGNPHVNSCFCDDAEAARTTRRRVLEECAESGALLLPAHFGRPHGIYVSANATGFGFRLPH